MTLRRIKVEELVDPDDGSIELIRVDGDSMMPTLSSGQIVVADKRERVFAVGEIVLALHPYRKSVRVIKRILAMLPDGYDLRGDNPNESTDSRTLGLFPTESILGRVTAVLETES